MNIAYGIRWDDGKRVRLAAFLLAALVAVALLALASLGRQDAGPLTAVVVSAKDDSAKQTVEELGGKVGRDLSVVNGFVAEVPADHVDELQDADGVRFAVADRDVELADADAPADTDADGVANAEDSNDNSPAASLALARKVVGADELAARGIDGEGVDIAMIDSGVVPAPGLDAENKVVNGPDFSDEGGTDMQFLDTYGHGTHLAGIMVANDGSSGFKGIAPGSRLVNVKAASRDGATSLMQLVFAMQFVADNKNTDGLNIRVLNLSLGADVLGSYIQDPLAYAAEQLWQKGIVVVSAVGNGNDSGVGLDSPAVDPFVVAAGATSPNGTVDRADDFVADWSRVSKDRSRTPDVVAPGTSLVSLRVEGSHIDETHPEGRVGDVYFKGSGTSQAAAVVSASAALLVDANPSLTPDQVKAALKGTATAVGGDVMAEGNGQIDADAASKAEPTSERQTHRQADLRKVIRSVLAEADSTRVDAGEMAGDLSASRWSASRWSASRWSASRWSASRWSASRWSASRWSASRWSASRWSASRWSASRWSASRWSASRWSASRWSASRWSGSSWGN